MLIPVILSGGAGTRLWPVSREAHPKPFMKLADGKSLLQKTVLRAASLPGIKNVLTITNRDYYFRTRDEYDATKLPSKIALDYLLEPEGRNTAPAIAMAALYAEESGPGNENVLLVLPADQLIADHDVFKNAIGTAVKLARKDYLVVFGIKPDRPETGFGYIKCGAKCGMDSACHVSSFVEKPQLEMALEFLSQGGYLWNSGMFCFKTDVFLRALEKHAPEVHAAALSCWQASRRKTTPIELDSSFANIQSISVDFAVMEKAQQVAVVPGEFGWSDLGSWDAVCALAPADKKGNRTEGEAVLIDSSNCYVRSEDRVVAALGIDDLVIVDTPDALLVSKKDRVQDVKQVVEQLKSKRHESYRIHRMAYRPWGTYTVLGEGNRFKIKRIEVKPGASLSLQMHHHRSEHWVVVSGTAKVTNDDQTFLVRTNESTFIPAGHKHRLENPGTINLVMIEVQSGEYLGEDDIVRFEDKYGRSQNKSG